MKKRICHICNLGMNGKAVFLCNVLGHTDYSKYDVTILNYRGDCAPAIIERVEKLPVKVVCPKDRSQKTFIKLVKSYLKNNSFDVVHSHIWDLSGVFLREAKKNKVPVRVAHSHTTAKAAGRYNVLKEFIRDKLLWNVLRYMIQVNANRFAACSDEAACWLFTRKIVNQFGYQVIINGIDLDIFKPTDIKKNDTTQILFSGRLLYQKNPLFAVEVFGKYHERKPNSHLTMIGKGEMQMQVEKKINELGLADCVTIISETAQMAEYYQMADVFLFPSNYEGLGIVAIEAQACGTKCLASDQVPKLTQCGMVVYLPRELGVEKWAEELESLVNNQKLSLNREALQNFSIHATVEQIDELYK